MGWRPPARGLRQPKPPGIGAAGSPPWRALAGALLASGFALQAPAVFQGPDVERFLRTARVVEAPRPGRDALEPSHATLTLRGATRRAFWLTIDSARRDRPGADALAADGGIEETYRAECAAYEVDRLLQLGMVPATIERVISGARGALTIDVEPAMTEADRAARGLDAPDVEEWERQLLKMRFFDHLIYNIDREPGTILISTDWQIRLAGHTRAFRDVSTLRDPETITRVSRSLLSAAERLNESALRRHLERYVSVWQIRALLRRRDRLVALARELAAKYGPDVVYYP